MATSVKFTIEPRDDIRSVDEFVSEISGLSAEDKHWYRGLSSTDYKMFPTIGRSLNYAGRKRTLNAEEERDLLHRFRRRAHPHVGRAITAGEAIFLARHHKLPTRLLDWSANALVSLYFACCEEHKCSTGPDKRGGRVWAMRLRKRRIDLDPFELAKREKEEHLFRPYESTRDPAHPSTAYAIKIVHPLYNSPRIVAQDGVFTFHHNPCRCLEDLAGEEFVEDCLDIEKLYSWIVPEASKVKLLEVLSGLGITQRTVYPDLDGVAASLWQTEVLFKGA